MAISVKTEKDAQPRKPRLNKKTGARALLAGLTLVLVMLGLYYRDQLSGGNFKPLIPLAVAEQSGDTGEILVDTGLKSCYAAIPDGLAALATDGLKLYDGAGKERLYAQAVMKAPSLRTKGEYALGFDRGGTGFVYTRAFTLAGSGQAEEQIINAGLSENGGFVLVTNQSGDKAAVTVYDAAVQPVFKWYSSERYVIDAAVSPDGKRMAAACIGQKNGTFFSSILVFDLSKEPPIADNDIMDTAVLSVFYTGKNSLCAVAQDRVVFYDGKGKQAGEFSFGENCLRDFSVSQEGFAAILLGRYQAGGDTTVHILGAGAKELSQAAITEEVRQISAAGKYVGVLYADTLKIYASDMKETASCGGLGDVRSVVMREDGSALLIGARFVKLFTP